MSSAFERLCAASWRISIHSTERGARAITPRDLAGVDGREALLHLLRAKLGWPVRLLEPLAADTPCHSSGVRVRPLAPLAPGAPFSAALVEFPAGPARAALREMLRSIAARPGAAPPGGTLFICAGPGYGAIRFAHLEAPGPAPAVLRSFAWQRQYAPEAHELCRLCLSPLAFPAQPEDTAGWRRAREAAFDPERLADSFFLDLTRRLRDHHRGQPAGADADRWRDAALRRVARLLFGRLGSPSADGGDPHESEADPPPAAADSSLFADDWLEAYPFTSREGTPLDVEVAVDPEMAGRACEVLAALDVTETGDGRRAGAGIVYTPRAEVDLMCRLVLLDYLAGRLGEVCRAELRSFVFAQDREEKRDADRRVARAGLWAALDSLLRRVTVCDPACGSGSFLVVMLQVLDDLRERAARALGRTEAAAERLRNIAGRTLHGVEVEGWAAEVTRRRLGLLLGGAGPPAAAAGIRHDDALVPREAGGVRRRFDIVIGNPPYVRQESIADPLGRLDPAAYKGELRARAAAAFPGFFQPDRAPKPDGRSDLYVYFLLRGLSLLSTGGRLCFVTSNSWLDVGFGAPLQELLLRHGHVKLILESGVGRSFRRADINTVITLLGPASEGPLSEAERRARVARFVTLEVPLSRAARSDLWSAVENGQADPEARVVLRDQRALHEEGLAPTGGRRRGYAGGKWGGRYLRAPDVYRRILERAGDGLAPLGEVAVVRRGVTTGANDFFYVRPVATTTNARRGEASRAIAAQDPVAWPRCFAATTGDLRIATDTGAEHLLPAALLCPAIVRPGSITRPHLLAGMADRLMVRIPPVPVAELPECAQAYIRWGAAAGFPLRPSLRGRRFWYSLSPGEPGWVLTPMARKRRPLLAWNAGRLHVDHNLFEVLPHDGGDRERVAACLLSTFSVLEAELLGRANLGQGALKTEGIDIARFSVLRPGAEASEGLAEAFRALAERRFLMIYDDVRLPDRAALDDAFLQAAGFMDPGERQDVMAELHDAACRLVWARQSRTGNARESRMAYAEWAATGRPFGA